MRETVKLVRYAKHNYYTHYWYTYWKYDTPNNREAIMLNDGVIEGTQEFYIPDGFKWGQTNAGDEGLFFRETYHEIVTDTKKKCKPFLQSYHWGQETAPKEDRIYLEPVGKFIQE